MYLLAIIASIPVLSLVLFVYLAWGSPLVDENEQPIREPVL